MQHFYYENALLQFYFSRKKDVSFEGLFNVWTL